MKPKKQQVVQQDYEALLKAKYCPPVTAASCTEKKQENHVTFTDDLEIH